MWPEPTASPRGWRVSSDRIPLLAAVFCGAALVVCVICALLVYRCCIMPRKEKHYCLRRTDVGVPNQQSIGQQPSYPSQSAVFVEQKGCSWGYTNRLVACSSTQGGQWFQNGPNAVAGGPHCTQCSGCPVVVPRSSSHPGNSVPVPQPSSNQRKPRPVSQPIGLLIPNGDSGHSRQLPLPEISEFSPQGTQYASSSILDEVSTKDEECQIGGGSTTLKTRSLPAWVRSKPRPLSTEDDLTDLYAKVNFSKKRKNRMRNDEAAIIALSKSRSQFLHKDTDSLVDNEAVIVYDERTAL
ncbi:uncharacterized protein [Onthophagus taurus]